MTELRNRPGDVLDRVAEGGEAFIIERNGQRRACLVPLSYFFPDISPKRIADEIEALVRIGEQPRTTITRDNELAFRFHDNDGACGPVEITVVLPHRYPSSCPRVYLKPVDPGAPHRWADGALCVFGVMSAWNPGKHTVASTLGLARHWLTHYAEWRATGRWPSTGIAP